MCVLRLPLGFKGRDLYIAPLACTVLSVENDWHHPFIHPFFAVNTPILPSFLESTLLFEDSSSSSCPLLRPEVVAPLRQPCNNLPRLPRIEAEEEQATVVAAAAAEEEEAVIILRQVYRTNIPMGTIRVRLLQNPRLGLLHGPPIMGSFLGRIPTTAIANNCTILLLLLAVVPP